MRTQVPATLLVLVAACGDDLAYRFDHLVDLTGQSPYADGCTGAPARGVVYPGFEVEPAIAVDPANDRHLVASWQQDRWSNGGANGIGTAVSTDGGAHWQRSVPRFSRCDGGAYERASDPWLAIGATGTYAIAIAFDSADDRSVVLAASSRDGGATWDTPKLLIDDNDPDVLNDKESITADDAHAYAVWDRLTGLTQPNKPVGTGPTLFARNTDGAWEPHRVIYDPGVDAQTIGNIVAVLPDGALLDVFQVITMASSKSPQVNVAVIRSTDHGDTWSDPVVIAPVAPVGLAKSMIGVRDGAGLPSIAVDPGTGAVYVAWQDSRFAAGDHDGIAIARSFDGGLTWAPPVQANGVPDVPAFTPAVAVADDGTVGVTYYDVREDDPQAAAFRVTAWLATSQDRGATWSDQRLSSAFDLRPALIADSYYFLGDYQGLAARGDGFAALFAVAFVDEDRTDIFVRP